MTAPLPPDDAESEVTAAEDRLWRALLAALARDRFAVVVAALARALLARDLDAALQALALTNLENALAALRLELAAIRALGWQQALAGLPSSIRNALPATSLDATAVANPDLLRQALALDLSRITAITEETRNALRKLIAQGLLDGTHPTVLARTLRDLIGLNARQATAVAAYRDRLIAEGRPLDQIDRMVARRTRVLLNQRAKTIAITETRRALSEGARLQYQRLIDTGAIDANAWRVFWQTREDERVCPICEPLDGQYIPIGGTFVTSVGMLDGPPGHVLCRCTSRLRPVVAAPRIGPTGDLLRPLNAG